MNDKITPLDWLFDLIEIWFDYYDFEKEART